MARLTREVEQYVLVAQERRETVRIAHVGDVHRHPVLQPGDVREVAAVLRDERVDEDDVRTRVGELTREVRAEEAQPTGDKHALAGERLSRHASRARGGLARR